MQGKWQQTEDKVWWQTAEREENINTPPRDALLVSLHSRYSVSVHAAVNNNLASELYLSCEVWFSVTHSLSVPFHIPVLIGHMCWCFCPHPPHSTWEVIRTILLPTATVGNLLQPATPLLYNMCQDWADWADCAGYNKVTVHVRAYPGWMWMWMRVCRSQCFSAYVYACQHGISEALTA